MRPRYLTIRCPGMWPSGDSCTTLLWAGWCCLFGRLCDVVLCSPSWAVAVVFCESLTPSLSVSTRLLYRRSAISALRTGGNSDNRPSSLCNCFFVGSLPGLSSTDNHAREMFECNRNKSVVLFGTELVMWYLLPVTYSRELPFRLMSLGHTMHHLLAGASTHPYQQPHKAPIHEDGKPADSRRVNYYPLSHN